MTAELYPGLGLGQDATGKRVVAVDSAGAAVEGSNRADYADDRLTQVEFMSGQDKPEQVWAGKQNAALSVVRTSSG